MAGDLENSKYGCKPAFIVFTVVSVLLREGFCGSFTQSVATDETSGRLLKLPTAHLRNSFFKFRIEAQNISFTINLNFYVLKFAGYVFITKILINKF